MVDPLDVLREFTIDNKKIIESDGQIIFGDWSWPKYAKTSCVCMRSSSSGTSKDYYTLETLLFLVKNGSLEYPNYVSKAQDMNIPVVKSEEYIFLWYYLCGKTNYYPFINTDAPFMKPSFNRHLEDKLSEPSNQTSPYEQHGTQQKNQSKYRRCPINIHSKSSSEGENYHRKFNIGYSSQHDVSRKNNVRDNNNRSRDDPGYSSQHDVSRKRNVRDNNNRSRDDPGYSSQHDVSRKKNVRDNNNRSRVDPCSADDYYKTPPKICRLERRNIHPKSVMSSDRRQYNASRKSVKDSNGFEVDSHSANDYYKILPKIPRLEEENIHTNYMMPSDNVRDISDIISTIDESFREANPVSNLAPKGPSYIDKTKVQQKYPSCNLTGDKSVGNGQSYQEANPVSNFAPKGPSYIDRTKVLQKYPSYNLTGDKSVGNEQSNQEANPVSNFAPKGPSNIDRTKVQQKYPSCNLTGDKNVGNEESNQVRQNSNKIIARQPCGDTVNTTDVDDPVSVLREFTAKKKPITEWHGFLVFDQLYWRKTVKTKIECWRTIHEVNSGIPKTYYTLDCLLFLTRKPGWNYETYYTKGNRRGLQRPLVTRYQHKAVLSYLMGRTEDCEFIDPNFSQIKQQADAVEKATQGIDPVILLRNYHAIKKPIVEQEDRIILGQHSWPKDFYTQISMHDRTLYEARGLPKINCTLECCYFLMKNSSLNYKSYRNKAHALNVAYVPKIQHPILRRYLEGVIERDDYLNLMKTRVGFLLDNFSEETSGIQAESVTVDQRIPEEVVVKLPVAEDKHERSEMIDPLSLLRHYFMNNKRIIVRDNLMIFGHIGIPKNAETNCGRFPLSRGRKYSFVPYSLECLYFFMQNWPSMGHSLYAKLALGQNKDFVDDRNAFRIYSYLMGYEVECNLINPNRLFDQRQIIDVGDIEICKNEPSSLCYTKKNGFEEHQVEKSNVNLIDPLVLLRDYNINKKDIIERDDRIVFGNISVPKDAETKLVKWGTQEYYTLGCLVFLLQNLSDTHAEYVQKALADNRSYVKEEDCNDVINYLYGNMDLYGNQNNIPTRMNIFSCTRTLIDLLCPKICMQTLQH